MSLKNLTIGDVQRLKKLLERKEKLTKQIAGIDKELDSFGAAPSTPKKSKKAASRRKKRTKKVGKSKAVKRTKAKRTRSRISGLKDKIVSAVQKAGPQGIKVGDLAKSIKAKEPSVRTWLYTSGKKIKELAKTGPGKYAWKK